MKNILFSLLSILIASGNIYAQTNTDVKDPKAKAILDKLSAQNKTYNSLQANFDYLLKNERDGIDEKQSGKISLKGDMYKLEIAGQEITSDGKTMWTFIKDDKELQISDAVQEDEEELFMSPSKLFSMYENGFKYAYDKADKLDGVNVDIIKLYPEDPKKVNFHTAKLYIQQEKSELKKVEIFAKDGNLFTYILRDFKANPNLTDAFFKVDESIADDVIDLR